MSKILILIIVAIPLMVTGTVAQTTTAQSPKIQLVVVAVPEFETTKYNVKGFKEAIEERCEDLKHFFEQQFGKEGLEPHIYCTKEDTTSTKIKRLFQTDFKDIAANTLTFVFIISHGEASNYNARGLPTDLRIVTSTSDPNEPDLSYLSFATELMSWFQKIPAGSTVLTFVDTCYAGNAASPAVGMTAAVQQLFNGMRLFVMGSSLRLEESYGAAFTKALLTLWGKQNGCVDPQSMENDIRDEIDRTIEAPLNDFQGIAKVIVGYAGPLCFTNAGSDGRLLFLYGGTQLDMVWKVFEGATVVQDKKPLKRGAFTERFFDMARLNAGTYRVQFLTQGQRPNQAIVDLNAHTFEAVFAEQPKSVADLKKFTEAMRDAIVANGKSSADTETLTQVVGALNPASADEDLFIHSIRISGQSFQNLNALRESAFKGKVEAQQAWQAKRIIPEDAAVGLFLLGDFSNSAEAFRLQAYSSKDEPSRTQFARDASMAFNLAGESKEAAQVAAEFGLRDHIAPYLPAPPGNLRAGVDGAGVTSAYLVYTGWFNSYHRSDSGTVAVTTNTAGSPTTISLSLATVLVSLLPGSLLTQTTQLKHTIGFTFDYDFRVTRACSPKVSQQCVQQFNLYDISVGIAKRTKLASIPVAAGVTGFLKGISGTTEGLLFASGKHLLAVTAQMPNGAESDSSQCTTVVIVP